MGTHGIRKDWDTSRVKGTLGVIFLLVSSVGAVESTLQIPRVDERISVDGVLDEAVWDSAWSMFLDYEVRPGENTPALAFVHRTGDDDAEEEEVGNVG